MYFSYNKYAVHSDRITFVELKSAFGKWKEGKVLQGVLWDRKQRELTAYWVPYYVFFFNPILINAVLCLLSIMKLFIFTFGNREFTQKSWIGLIINIFNLHISNFMCMVDIYSLEIWLFIKNILWSWHKIHLIKMFAFTLFNFFVTLSTY